MHSLKNQLDSRSSATASYLNCTGYPGGSRIYILACFHSFQRAFQRVAISKAALSRKMSMALTVQHYVWLAPLEIYDTLTLLLTEIESGALVWSHWAGSIFIPRIRCIACAENYRLSEEYPLGYSNRHVRWWRKKYFLSFISLASHGPHNCSFNVTFSANLLNEKSRVPNKDS